MNKLTTVALGAALLLATTISSNAIAARPNPVVKFTTTYGAIEIELYRAKAPISVKNFMSYVRQGYYNGMIFHRVIKGFMIQSGGFKPGMRQIPAARSIQNEADNGLKNTVGTIAMARTNKPHSAGAQFFINTNNNTNLDHRSKTDRGWGYAVFGKVTKGMQTVRRIESAPTQRSGYYSDVPVKDIVILKASVLRE